MKYCYDAVSSLAHNLPRNADMVMGYVTGGQGITWTQAQYDQFTGTKLYVDQGHGTPWRKPNVLDVEAGDYAPGQIPGRVAELVKEFGEGPLAVYCTIGNADAVHKVWKGPVILACPSYPEDAAAVTLANAYRARGVNVVMCQNVWQANLDRSVVIDDSWLAPKQSVKPGKPEPAPVHVLVTWVGAAGLTSRATSLPWSVWETLKWSDPS